MLFKLSLAGFVFLVYSAEHRYERRRSVLEPVLFQYFCPALCASYLTPDCSSKVLENSKIPSRSVRELKYTRSGNVNVLKEPKFMVT